MRSLFAAALALAAWGAGAQIVPPGRPLEVVTTSRFDIYYPPSLSIEAARLASFADEVRAELEARFPGGFSRSRRIPVLLADGYSSTNGSYFSSPSSRLVLYVAPPRLFSELGLAADDLRAAFSHELAHLLSMSSRTPPWSFLSAVFGDPVEPSRLTATDALIEGAAILAEGANGRGRAQDPLAAALVRQDILEGAFKDFWQASGAWDAYPFDNVYYQYGGLFTRFLLERYGEARYAELWRRLGGGNVLAGVEGGLFMKGAFEAAYGRRLDDAWEEFRGSMALRGPVVMETRRLSRRPGYITALAAGPSGLFWADASAGAVLSLAPDIDEAGGRKNPPASRGMAKPTRLFAADISVERLDVSPDGELLLVSCARYSGELSGPEVLIRDARTGLGRGVGPRGLREAAFAGDAIVGIAARGFATDLVIERRGERRVLLKGRPGLSFASPASPDGRTVYCLAKDSGRVLLLRVDAPTGLARALVPSLPIDDIRSLSLSSGPSPEAAAAASAAALAGSRGETGAVRALLALSYAGEGDLYRLALLCDRGETEASLYLQEALLSGSVLLPAASGEIYYVGRFADGEYPCAYPTGVPALSLREAKATWEPFDGGSPGEEGADPPAAIAGSRKAPPLPLLLRTFRLPMISDEGDAAGLAILGADLARRVSWELDALYEWEVRGADLALYLELGLHPWDLSLSLSDGFTAHAAGETRTTMASFGASRSWRAFPARRSVELRLGGGVAALAPAEAGNAYGSAYEIAGAVVSASLRGSSYRRGYFPPFGREGAGADAAADAEWTLVPASGGRPAFSLAAGLDGAVAPLGLSASLRAALSPDGSVEFGPTYRALATTGVSILEPPYWPFNEYGSLTASGSLYVEGSTEATIFSLELQRRLAIGELLCPVYFDRVRLAAGARAALYGAGLAGLSRAELLSSVFGRLLLQGAPLVGTAASARVTAGAELAWAFRGDLVPSPLRLAFLAGLEL